VLILKNDLVGKRMDMFENLLSGYRALDLTDEKGFICGKILATLGIEVIKVEPPGGDPARSILPFLNGEPDINNSLYWLSYNTDKHSITLNIEFKRGRALFRKLVAKCDFLIESFRPGYLDSIGLGYIVLTKINPRIILTSITPFGQKGPYSGFKGSELVVSAMSGIMSTNGDSDRSPLREGPDTIYFESGAAAALGTVTAHYVREKTGEGQQVDVSMQEVAVKRTSSNLLVWEFDKCLIKRAGTIRTIGARSTHWIWECKDGHIFWSFMGGKPGSQGNRAMSKWIDDDGMENPLRVITNWEEFDMAAQDVSKDLLDAQQEAIRQFFLRHTKKEITEEGFKRGLNACAINDPSDILENPQLKTREYWANINSLKTDNPLKYPKYFFLSNQTENFVKSAAPVVGEYNDVIYRNELKLSAKEITKLESSGVI
jgi:crotonobetainyl-CoA:carnitine CoA-transferase CaiB-like acyl-CoA transferase